MRKIYIALLIFLVYGCGASTTKFVRIGDKTYPPKPESSEIMVFNENESPRNEYSVIGMVYTIAEPQISNLSDREILELLKKEARKQGADAMIDVKIRESRSRYDIEHHARVPRCKSGEAKAVVFK